MPSFDVVSEVDHHELTNAIDQTNREISQRYDLKTTSARVEKEDDNTLRLTADSEFHAGQVMDILLQKLAKRGIDVGCVEAGEVTPSGKTVYQIITIREGLDQSTAKKMIKLIKDSKLKVQAQVQGDKIRVQGKKRDDLQSVIALLKGAELGLPLQFQNFRD